MRSVHEKQRILQFRGILLKTHAFMQIPVMMPYMDKLTEMVTGIVSIKSEMRKKERPGKM